MRITRLEIHDLFGTRDFAFELGTLTWITGENGAGKSSILKAIALVFEGGWDPSWIRKGASKGWVRLTLDTGATLTKTVKPTRSSSDIEVLDPQGEVIPAPMTFVRELGDSWAIDPAKLLAIDASTKPGKQKLIETLLQLLDLKIDLEEIQAAVPQEELCQSTAAGYLSRVGTLNLQELAKFRKEIEEARRHVGVDARNALGAVDSLKASLAGVPEGTDWAAEEQSLRAKLASYEAETQRHVKDAEAKINAKLQREVLDITAEAHNLRAQFDTALQALHTRELKAEQVAAARAKSDSQGVLDARLTDANTLVAQIATVRGQADAQRRAEGVRSQIPMWEKKHRELSANYDAHTELLRAVDAVRTGKLADLPVTGLEFDGENALVDGVEWQNVNTARLLDVALGICAARTGKLPFLVVDDAEHLDAQKRAEFEQAILVSDFQVVVAAVSDGPLTIRRLDPPAGAA